MLIESRQTVTVRQAMSGRQNPFGGARTAERQHGERLELRNIKEKSRTAPRSAAKEGGGVPLLPKSSAIHGAVSCRGNTMAR